MANSYFAAERSGFPTHSSGKLLFKFSTLGASLNAIYG
jgi:hypothetical protein